MSTDSQHLLSTYEKDRKKEREQSAAKRNESTAECEKMRRMLREREFQILQLKEQAKRLGEKLLGMEPVQQQKQKSVVN